MSAQRSAGDGNCRCEAAFAQTGAAVTSALTRGTGWRPARIRIPNGNRYVLEREFSHGSASSVVIAFPTKLARFHSNNEHSRMRRAECLRSQDDFVTEHLRVRLALMSASFHFTTYFALTLGRSWRRRTWFSGSSWRSSPASHVGFRLIASRGQRPKSRWPHNKFHQQPPDEILCGRRRILRHAKLAP